MLHFRVTYHTARLGIREPLFDLLADVDVVLDVLKRGVLRKHSENLLNLVLGGFHDVILSRHLPPAKVAFRAADKLLKCQSVTKQAQHGELHDVIASPRTRLGLYGPHALLLHSEPSTRQTQSRPTALLRVSRASDNPSFRRLDRVACRTHPITAQKTAAVLRSF
jgi:hypothetical protein